MDGAQSIEARFRSLDQKYILCNFHRSDDLDRAEAFLSAEDEPKALLLSGERGGGRSYFLESVVYRLHQAGRKIDLISIDLDGCETAPSSLGDAISQEANKNQQGGTLLPTAKLVFKIPLDSLLSLVMIQFEWSADKLAAFFRAEPQEIPGPKRRERDRFHRLLEKLCEGEIGVLHILDSAKLTVPLRQWILAEVQRIPNLKVVFSCHPSEATEAVAPEISNLRIEFGPYDKRACLEVINQRLTPNTFPEGLLDALWRSSQGLPGYLALKILDLVSADLLFRDARKIWRVAGYSLSDEAFVQEFTSDFHESVERVLNTQDATTKKRLRDFLHLAALCGESAPADLIFQYLRIDGEERDMLVDLIDEHWVGEHRDAFFIDHEYAHPSFPAHAVYSFVNPLYPPVLLRDVPARRQRAELATGFLTFLQKALPIQTRGIAHLFLELSRNLDDVPTRARYETMIAWWIDVEDAEALTCYLAHELQERRLNHDILWQAARMNQTLWPPYRRLALLEALEQQKQGLPIEWAGAFLHEKALVFYEMSRYADAEPLFRRALITDERYYGPDHVDVSRDLNGLAELLRATNRLVEAEPLFQRALMIAEQRHVLNHPEVANILNGQARLLQATKRMAEAEPLFERALAIDERHYGPRHPNVARDLNNLADLLQATNRLAEAEPLLERALAIDRYYYGSNHHNVARDLNNLANLLRNTNRMAKAEPLFWSALAINEQYYGPDHPDVAIVLNNLASLLRATHRLGKAEPLYRRSLSILLKSTQETGHEHPHLRIAIGNYKRCLQQMEWTEDLIAQRLSEAGHEAGFDEEQWRQMLAQFQ